MSRGAMEDILAEETECRADLAMVVDCKDRELEKIGTSVYFLLSEVRVWNGVRRVWGGAFWGHWAGRRVPSSSCAPLLLMMLCVVLWWRWAVCVAIRARRLPSTRLAVECSCRARVLKSCPLPLPPAPRIPTESICRSEFIVSGVAAAREPLLQRRVI